MGRVEVRAPLHPTEDEEKVREAIGNIASPSEWRVVEDGGKLLLIASSSTPASLLKLRERLRRQRTLDAARYMIKRFSTPHRLTFYLHKQAAYMGHAVFCLPRGESPLGAIEVVVEGGNLERVLDWLAPPTANGKPLFELEEVPEDP